MLEVQNYLTSGKTLEDLSSEYGIVAKMHNTLPLVILNYDQIESKPKHHPIVRECRALLLECGTWKLVARSFRRFFNWGELTEEMELFDFSDFATQTKEDGSLVTIYHYEGEWHANTRGSFGLDNMQHQIFNWREGICRAMGIASLEDIDVNLNPKYAYICEFVSPWNKIVRRYDKAGLYLLTIFEGERELTHHEVDKECANLETHFGAKWFYRPDRHQFSSMKEIEEFLSRMTSEDPTFEGVVIRDRHGMRYKVKNPAYISLHRMRGEGDNMYNPKHLLPFIMSGNDSEVLLYFPEIKEAYFKLKSELSDEYGRLVEVWADHKDIEGQKEFALAIKDKTPYTSVLFNLRKKFGPNQKSSDLRAEWRTSEDIILKKLKA
jgi:hypothetical protein